MLSEGQQLTEALRLNPNLLPARIELEHFSLLHNRAEATLELLNQTPPAQRTAWNCRPAQHGSLRAWQGNGARASFGPQLAAARIPEFLLQDALLRIKLRDFDGAGKSVREALEKKPGDVTALETLSVTYIAQNRKEQALKAVQEETQLDASGPALVFLGQP